MCPIEAPLELEIMFTSDGPIPNTKWRVKYVVDTVHHRHEVDILPPPARHPPARPHPQWDSLTI